MYTLFGEKKVSGACLSKTQRHDAKVFAKALLHIFLQCFQRFLAHEYGC